MQNKIHACVVCVCVLLYPKKKNFFGGGGELYRTREEEVEEGWPARELKNKTYIYQGCHYEIYAVL